LATFFVSSINNDSIVLDENDSKHAIKVLRLKKDDLVDINDGCGTKINGVIIDADPKKTKVKVLKKVHSKKPILLGLAFCPTKNNDRNDWIIEKATEIGVTDFHPIYSQNSERRKFNENRMKKITISAIKQSGNLWLPKIHPLISFNSFLEKKFLYNNKLMAHCKDGVKSELKKITNNNDSQVIIIGPEGDFTYEEISSAEKYGFKMISLGTNRLRTETACISAISIMKLM
tara:strand:+ start:2793 stop:3485 length:693 start_codon:yes stop_codon:yes gene_type:complete